MIEDKKGRGTLSSPTNPSLPLFEADYHLHIEQADEPPNRPGVEVTAIKWVNLEPGRRIPNGDYVLTDADGNQHLVHCEHLGNGWAYGGPFVPVA
jgi:hypothetical protein